MTILAAETIKEQIAEHADAWGEPLDFDHAPDGSVCLAWVKQMRIPVAPGIAIIEDVKEPCATLDADQPISLVMEGRRRWWQDPSFLIAASQQAREERRAAILAEVEPYEHEMCKELEAMYRDKVTIPQGG